jgi:endonuclease G, mitochondrial
VVTGAVFDRSGDGNRDPDRNVARISPTNRVAVPTHFYKMILHVRPKVAIYSITILLPHVDRSVGPTAPYLSRHITSIDHVEQLTGINFFPQLPNDVENAIEAFQAPRLWNTQ